MQGANIPFVLICPFKCVFSIIPLSYDKMLYLSCSAEISETFLES